MRRSKPCFALCAATVLSLVLFAGRPASAARSMKSWVVSLPLSSGVSDPGIGSVVTGVSEPAMSSGTPFQVDTASGATIIDLSRQDHTTLLIVQPDAIEVLNTVTPVYTDATASVTIYWRESMTISGLENAEKIPIYMNKALTAGDTPYTVPAVFTSALYGFFTFESQCTAWEKAALSVYAMNAPPGITIQPVRIGGNTYVVNTNSGVSSIATVPQGTRKTVIHASGGTIYYTVDATNPDPGDGMLVVAGESATILGYQPAKDLRFREQTGGSGVTVFAIHYTR